MRRSSRDIFGPPAGPSRSWVTWALIPAVLLVIAGLFWGGEFLARLAAYRVARPASPLTEPARDILRNTYHLLPHVGRRAELATRGLPIYDVRMSPRNLAKLRATADEVCAKEFSTDVVREWMPAEFLLEDRWIPIKAKLRGLTKYHYATMLPSLRLKFPKKQLFHGKRQINLSNPYDKGLASDITVNWELRQRGLLTWDDAFVILRLNGDIAAVYQETEQFGRSIIDRSGRPEGYIFSGLGQLFGAEGADYDKARRAIDQVSVFAGERYHQPVAHCTWEFIDEYFDTDRLTWAAAMIHALGSSHGWNGDNIRLYWNPAYGQFEPIPWDYNFHAIDFDVYAEGKYISGFDLAFGRTAPLRRMRNKRLWTILTERIEPMIEHADQIFAELAPSLEVDIRHPTLGLDEAYHASFAATLRANRAGLIRLLTTHDLTASVWPRGDHVIIAAENRGVAAVVVEGVDGIALREPVVVDGIWNDEPGRAVFVLENLVDASGWELELRNQATGQRVDPADCVLVAGAGSPPDLPAPKTPPPIRVPANVRIEDRLIVWGPGRVVLDSTLDLSRDYEVVFAPGLELQLAEGASLLIRGGLQAIGAAQHPIRIGGAPGWGALALQGTRTRPVEAELEHVHFTGGTGAQSERTRFSGTLSVHGGVVDMRNCRVQSSGAEDAVNLKHCDVQLHDNHVWNSPDDAVDLDFCIGEVSGNRIERAGGDGLDLSGARVTVERNAISDCDDKGISIGEGTYATVHANAITRCHTGIAVKDLSHAEISNCGLAHLEVGISLYIKKLTFGPSDARVEHLAFYEVASPFLCDRTCTLAQQGSVRYHSAPLLSAAGTIPLDRDAVPPPSSARELRDLLTADRAAGRACGIPEGVLIP